PGSANAAENAAAGGVFGDGGIVRADFGSQTLLMSVAVQPDGKILAVGRGGDVAGQFAIARYLPDGRPDAGFGNKGVALTDFGVKQDHYATATAVQSDGKIIVAGAVPKE